MCKKFIIIVFSFLTFNIKTFDLIPDINNLQDLINFELKFLEKTLTEKYLFKEYHYDFKEFVTQKLLFFENIIHKELIEVRKVSCIYFKIKSIDAKLASLHFNDEPSKNYASRESEWFYRCSKRIYPKVIDEIEKQWCGDPEKKIRGYLIESMSFEEQLKDERAFFVLKYLNGFNDSAIGFTIGYAQLKENFSEGIPLFDEDFETKIKSFEDIFKITFEMINRSLNNINRLQFNSNEFEVLSNFILKNSKEKKDVNFFNKDKIINFKKGSDNKCSTSIFYKENIEINNYKNESSDNDKYFAEKFYKQYLKDINDFKIRIECINKERISIIYKLKEIEERVMKFVNDCKKLPDETDIEKSLFPD